MPERELRTEIRLPRPQEEVFAFFADAGNLEAITPPWLNFRIVTPQPIHMEAGTLIDYKLRIRGLPMHWRTRISAWEPPFRFVDEQIRGPYRTWIHEHTFEADGDETLVRDHVRYDMPFLFLLDRFIVRPDVERIFAHREKRMRELFPKLERA